MGKSKGFELFIAEWRFLQCQNGRSVKIYLSLHYQGVGKRCLYLRAVKNLSV